MPTTDVIEVMIPGSLEGDAAKALAALGDAVRHRRKAMASAAALALRGAATWVYGSPAWDDLRRAAQAIELRLHTGRPWVRFAREQLERVGPLLRQLAGEEPDRDAE